MMLSDFVEAMKPRPHPGKKNALAFAAIVMVVFAFYFASLYVPPGWLTYWISSISLLLVTLTAWARLNDIKETTLRYQVRRLGLILVIAACTGLVMKPWVAAQMDWPTWGEVMLRLGVTLVWMTTPMMPPWDRYISGKFRKQTIEVAPNVEVEVVRTDTVAGGGMFDERRKSDWPEDGP